MVEELSSGTLELYRYFSIKPSTEEIKVLIVKIRPLDKIDKELLEYLVRGETPKSSIALYHVDTQPAKDDSLK